MKAFLAIATAFSLMVMPFLVFAQSEQTATVAPPISQQLVPEGVFALDLATALNLGTPETEAQAEDMLASVGIAPKNGWIADYPMTPIVIGEVESAVSAAAEAGKLSMGKDEALQALKSVTAKLTLPVTPAPERSAENQPPTSSGYVQPTVINNYYYNEGPPVVTYYPPPWDYGYLYVWVPYPFWCSSFFFPGFFILHDFNITVTHNFHHERYFYHYRHPFRHVITNHFFDPKTHAYLRVDPTMRTIGRSITRVPGATRHFGFKSPQARRGADSILNRNFERGRHHAPSGRARGRFEGTVPRPSNGRTFKQPGNIERRHGNLQGHFTRPGRSFGAYSRRNFGSQPERSGRSFSPRNRSFGSPPETGRSSSGGSHGAGFEGFRHNESRSFGRSGGPRGGSFGGHHG
jgi:hypothetical protein